MNWMQCFFVFLFFGVGVGIANAAITEEDVAIAALNNQPVTPALVPPVLAGDTAVENKLISLNSTSALPPNKSSSVTYNGSMPSTTATLLKALGGLMVVVCTIFLASALAKRVGLTNVSLRKRIQLRENVVVGNKERLVLVDFAGQSLLLGVTAGSISLLKTVPQINVGQNVAAKENSLGAKTALDFQQKLNAFLLKGQQ